MSDDLAEQIDAVSDKRGKTVTMLASTWAIHRYTMATLILAAVTVLGVVAADYLDHRRRLTVLEGEYHNRIAVIEHKSEDIGAEYAAIRKDVTEMKDAIYTIRADVQVLKAKMGGALPCD